MKKEQLKSEVFKFAFFSLIGIYLLAGSAESAQPVNSGKVAFKITVEAPDNSRDVRLWVPYPISGKHQTIEDVKIDGNFSYQGIYREPKTGNMALYAEWTLQVKETRFLNFSFNASAVERLNRNFPSSESDFPPEVRQYLKATHFIPIDGKVKEVALSVIKGKETVAEKARAVYDWVVENTSRDPSVKGCGIGDVEQALAKKGGKCADISSIYVAVARAAGVPAREVFGIRLGKNNGRSDLTKDHHCWAEFYLPGYGWVPVDPADVTKFVFVNKTNLERASSVREYYFGAVGPNRVTLGTGGRGHYLSPRQVDGPLNYFMYPYAEVNGKALDWLAAQKELKYQITYDSREP